MHDPRDHTPCPKSRVRCGPRADPMTKPSDTTDVKAVVVPGRGIAAKARAPEVEALCRIRSTSLVSGSLNLVSKKPVWLDLNTAFFASEHSRHFFWDAWLNGTPVILNRWIGCPVHVFELFAQDRLRVKHNLRDGDEVTLTLPISSISSPNMSCLKNRLVWYLVWRGREKHYYIDGWYTKCLRWESKSRDFQWRSRQGR